MIRNPIRTALLCAAGIVVAAGGFAAPTAPTLTVEISGREVRVGDLVEATLSIELDSTAGAPAFPNWQRNWGGAEIREVGDVARSEVGNGVALYSQRLLLTSFRPGSVTLPPVAATLASPEGPVDIATEPATFEVGSVLPAEQGELEPQPPAPPLLRPLGAPFWWTTGLVGALVTGLCLLILTRRKAESVYSGHVIDPWQALEQALARLATAADPEAVFTGLSLELRRYLGHCLAFPAAESTTTELRRRLLRSGLPPGVCGDVVRLLVEADSVKFAKRRPAPGRIPECLEQARVAASEIRDFLKPAPSDREDEAAA